MTIAITPLAERIARVLAGLSLSANADGEAASAARDVEMEWRDRLDDALAILKAIREPDRSMAEAGDAASWEAMVAAAIGDAQALQDSGWN